MVQRVLLKGVFARSPAMTSALKTLQSEPLRSHANAKLSPCSTRKEANPCFLMIISRMRNTILTRCSSEPKPKLCQKKTSLKEQMMTKSWVVTCTTLVVFKETKHLAVLAHLLHLAIIHDPPPVVLDTGRNSFFFPVARHTWFSSYSTEEIILQVIMRYKTLHSDSALVALSGCYFTGRFLERGKKTKQYSFFSVIVNRWCSKTQADANVTPRWLSMHPTSSPGLNWHLLREKPS